MKQTTLHVPALVLFAHGARDPRWAEPLTRIEQLVLQRVGTSVQVHQAFLELMTPTLPELVANLAAQHVEKITIVPIFLGQGAHIRHDLPKILQELQSSYPQVKFSLASAIGENPSVLSAIADACINSI